MNLDEDVVAAGNGATIIPVSDDGRVESQDRSDGVEDTTKRMDNTHLEDDGADTGDSRPASPTAATTNLGHNIIVEHCITVPPSAIPATAH